VADINIERKGPKVWPWLIGLVVLALIIWVLAEMMGTDTASEPEPAVDSTVVESPTMPSPPPPPAMLPDTSPSAVTDTV
jgi:hypothetical protein